MLRGLFQYQCEHPVETREELFLGKSVKNNNEQQLTRNSHTSWRMNVTKFGNLHSQYTKLQLMDDWIVSGDSHQGLLIAQIVQF